MALTFEQIELLESIGINPRPLLVESTFCDAPLITLEDGDRG